MSSKIYLFISLISFTLLSCSSKKKLTKPAPQKVLKENALVKNTSAQQYIEKFSEISVEEMNKYGIPASVTLAQGLLESGSGNGSLATQANNHFGIKCTAEWKGKSILKDDDIKDDCFRVYNNPEESFRDHSEFLKRKRYAFLFELDKNDYRGWAYGLKQAGYATNPKYPELLINLIERYGLDRYDQGETLIAKSHREEKVLTEIKENIPQEKLQETVKSPVVMKIYEVKPGDTLYAISKRFNLTVDEVRILNTIPDNNIKPGQLLLVSK